MPRRYVKLPALPEHLVATPAELADCLAHLSTVPIIGFDTEFVGEDAYRPELCLVQVSTADNLYVIDPFGVGPLEPFWELLADPGRTAVVHSGREDLRLCNFAIGRPPAHVFDVQLAAGLAGLTYPVGYAGLVQDLLGQRMNKGETLTDWRRRPLHPAQIRYAYDDVRYLLPAWTILTNRLKRAGRLTWAAEEFGGFVRKAVADDAAAERWRKVKGIGGFGRRNLAVAREVYGWRDDFARRVNRPPRTLLRDDLLAEIARRVPRTLDDLQSLRGLPRGEAEAILAAVGRAADLPAEELPEAEARDNDPSNVLTLASLLGVVLTDLCARKKLASNLVASGSDIKAVVRAVVGKRPLPDVPLTRGWRAAAILPGLLAVLAGKDAVRVVKPSAAAPLEYVPQPEPEPEAEGDEPGSAGTPADPT